MGNTLEGTNAHVDVVIIGGGPTGLGAAYRLHQYGFENWLLLDAEKHPGGLAGSIKTAEGFRFDHGYKILNSRYEYFDKVLQQLHNEKSGRKLIRSRRNNFVYIRGRMVCYPIQNNLGGLPHADEQASVLDLVRAKLDRKNSTTGRNEENLDDYLVSEWGESLCNLFFRPYLFKAWAYPTSKLCSEWASSKISPSKLGEDLERMLAGKQEDPGWGVDSESQYPEKGGLVGLWKSIVKTLPKNNVRFRSEISRLNIDEKMVMTKSGLQITYKNLISSMPLTSLLELSGREDLTESMINSSLYVVCIGVRGSSPHAHITGCIYFPESDVIFHRVCIFSSRDPDSVPSHHEKLSTIRLAQSEMQAESREEKLGPYWSLMLEVSGGPLKSLDEQNVADDAIRDACSVGLLRSDDEIVSIHLTEMTHGYPLPTLNSKNTVEQALEWLKLKHVWSRGRFGAFKYEIGDLDHCFIQGVEAVDNMLKGNPEKCLNGVIPEVMSSIPCYDIETLVDKSPLVLSDISESIVSDDAVEAASDSEQSINASSVRSAITSEPGNTSGAESN